LNRPDRQTESSSLRPTHQSRVSIQIVDARAASKPVAFEENSFHFAKLPAMRVRYANAVFAVAQGLRAILWARMAQAPHKTPYVLAT